MYVPPINFGIVEKGVYRSGQPCVLNFPFLERLDIKTMILLKNLPDMHNLKVFAKEQDIQLIHLESESKRKVWNPLSEQDVIAALDIILNSKNHPVLVFSQFGSHRTGAVIGCLRKIQGWNLTSILEEYRRYAGSKVRVLNEQFIELFDTDLIKLPPKTERSEWIYS